jgi:hypothetical protein
MCAEEINDRWAANELCDASTAIALKIGGWDDTTKLNSRQRQERRRAVKNPSR